MADSFKYDVFLSHSAKDKPVVRAIAERLRTDGLRVWLNYWEIRPGDNIRAKVEDGLEHSRVLVLCMSANAFGPDWAQLEVGTFRFRDPLNKERSFIPLRLDEAPIHDSLAQFSYIDWLPTDHEEEYGKLLAACSPLEPAMPEEQDVRDQFIERSAQLTSKAAILAYAFSLDGKRALTGGGDRAVRLWDIETGRCLRILRGHTDKVWSVEWSADKRFALSGGADKTVRLWDVETGCCLRVLERHKAGVYSAVWSADQKLVLSGSQDIRLWDAETGNCLRGLKGHTRFVVSVVWSADQRYALSGGMDNNMRLWDMEKWLCLRVFHGHTDGILSVALSADQRLALSGSYDKTLRLWDVETGRCLSILEGHTQQIRSVALSHDQRHALSGGSDETVRLWDLETGNCLCVLEGHNSEIRFVKWQNDQGRALSGDRNGRILVWDLSKFTHKMSVSESSSPALSFVPDQVQYTNAKILLVGETGAGKTGLSRRLTSDEWQPSDSTVGAWATQWKLPVSSGDGVEREIWLWDFGGQADQRLIHQLYMDETALAVLVFDGQKEDLFETLGQWDRDLTRASRQVFSKLLVAGRVDAGGLRVSRTQIEAFRKERGYLQLLETSAKTSLGCEELREAILDGVQWENIPWRSSPFLFKRLKEEIVRLKDAGRVLMRFKELRETLQLRLLEQKSGEALRFTDEELKAVVSLLAGPGVLWELKFGSWVLLQPERINAYAQAVIQTMREDEYERGCLPEERVLNGDLTYHSSMARLETDEERFVLLAMHQTLVERGLCLREHTDKGPLLIFPSYYRRERPELVGHPAVLVSYRFNGFLDDIYATLVVRLHHTRPFQQDQLWRYAADF